MPLSVTCSCGHQFRVESEFRGKEGPCPACGQTTRLEGRNVPAFDVFLSYSSKDKTIADAAVAVLEQRGLRCWVAPRNIVAGKEWGESIIEGIQSSGLMVLIFSQHSNSSQQVVREVERAVAKGIPIIPFRIEDIPASKAMEYFISCHHWLDALHPPLEKHLEKLADMASHVLGNAPPPKTEADDAKGLAGKLNAAVGTLLARDRRVRALTGLAAVLVVAALIVATSVFATRDPVASEDVVRAKAQAEVLAKELHQLDPAQGFGEKIAAVDQELNAAAALFGEKQFSKSLAAYQRMLSEGQKIIEGGKKRREAADKRASMEAARQAAQSAHAEEFAKNEWTNAGSYADRAADSYARADFRNASEHWRNSAEAYSAAADLAKKTGLPRLKALAFWTSIAVGNKWWFETLRPQPRAAAGGNEGGFDPDIGFVPGFQRRAGLPFADGGIPDLQQNTNDWPPYQATVRQSTVFLETEARDGLGVDSELIDRLISAQDPGLLDATATRIVEQITSRHGEDVEMAYRLGTNVAKLKIMCDLGASAPPRSGFRGGGGLRAPARGDIIRSTDYVMHRATVTGCPEEVIDTVKEIRAIFDEASDGLGDSDYSLTFAYQEMKHKMDLLYDKYFATVEAATAMFAKANPPANPPKFPSRSEADNERITRLEKSNAWFLLDTERFDRPPISIVFNVERGFFSVDPNPLMEDVLTFPHLRRLELRNLPLEDKHLARLPELKELRELWLGSEAITPAGMAHVAKIPQLEQLWLYGTGAPDEEIAPLAACKGLKRLGLNSKQVGDAACASLAKIKTLEQLHLSESAITDEGVVHLLALDKLTTLDLRKTKLTDASASHLGKLTNLEHLFLSETGLTDESLPQLKKLTKLKELDVSDTKITEQGTAELKNALPMCEVSRRGQQKLRRT